jgi:hypothetical protein
MIIKFVWARLPFTLESVRIRSCGPFVNSVVPQAPLATFLGVSSDKNRFAYFFASLHRMEVLVLSGQSVDLRFSRLEPWILLLPQCSHEEIEAELLFHGSFPIAVSNPQHRSDIQSRMSIQKKGQSTSIIYPMETPSSAFTLVSDSLRTARDVLRDSVARPVWTCKLFPRYNPVTLLRLDGGSGVYGEHLHKLCESSVRLE